MTRICTLLFSLLTTFSFAQQLTGVVRDARTNALLTGVTVQLNQGQQGTTTNQQGRFTLSKLTAGTYQVRVSSIGYRPATQTVTVTDQVNPSVQINLMPSVIQLNQQTVVTTQRQENPDFDRPEMTTVITARDLQQRSPRTVPEALIGATGVFLQKTNHGGGSPFVRGLTGQQTLILVDGIRLNNSTFRSGPNQYLNTIDPQSISQIEVLRSSGSVTYGSDAIGGVVNVLTKTPQFSEQTQVTGSVFGKAMTRDMEYSSRAELGVSTASVALLGGLAYRNFGDLVAGKGLGLQSPTGYNQLSGDIKARFRLSDRFVATAAYQSLRQDSVPVFHRVRLENYRYYQFNPQRRQLAYARLEGFFDHKFLQSVQLTALWQDQTEGRQSQRNNNPTAIYERDQTTTTGLTLLANAQPTRFWQMQNGVEWYDDRVNSSRRDVNTQTGVGTSKRGLYPNGATMSSLAIYSAHTITLNRLTLTAGGRYNAFRIMTPEAGPTSTDEAVIRPSALVGNAGLSLALTPSLRVVGSVQSAFRAPNIDDLGTLGVVDFRYEVPNANLRPERSLNTEAGVKLRTQRVSATLLAYNNRLTDFISRVRSGNDSIQGYPVFVKLNSAESFIRGLEAEAEYEFLPNWLAYGNLTYTYGQNVTANEPFRRIPPLNGRVGLTYQSPTGWWTRAEYLYAGAQTRLAAGDLSDNRIAKGGTPGWQVLNLNGGYRWQHVTISAEWQNITNEAYRTHGSGVDGVGSSAWLSVLVSW
ncbi:TonB-dependent receptor [Fibrella aquatica]|uniref:TonB-dependent receptor n=1 Tax=Fibrella aquatica TaxID=3242487 RepID=UPI003520EC42